MDSPPPQKIDPSTHLAPVWAKVQSRFSILAWILALVAFATNGWYVGSVLSMDYSCGLIYCTEKTSVEGSTSRSLDLFCVGGQVISGIDQGCGNVWASRILLLLSIIIGIFTIVCSCCGITDPCKLITFGIVILCESLSGLGGSSFWKKFLDANHIMSDDSSGYSIVLLTTSVILYCVAALIACVEFYKKANKKGPAELSEAFLPNDN